MLGGEKQGTLGCLCCLFSWGGPRALLSDSRVSPGPGAGWIDRPYCVPSPSCLLLMTCHSTGNALGSHQPAAHWNQASHCSLPTSRAPAIGMLMDYLSFSWEAQEGSEGISRTTCQALGIEVSWLWVSRATETSVSCSGGGIHLHIKGLHSGWWRLMGLFLLN